MKLTDSQESESVLENYLNCNQDELCQVTSPEGERIDIYVFICVYMCVYSYVCVCVYIYKLSKFHSYTNPLNVICLQLQVTKTPSLPAREDALDTFIQEDLEIGLVMGCID